jgi:hypothetical protein
MDTNGIRSKQNNGIRKKLKVVEFDVIEVSDEVRLVLTRLIYPIMQRVSGTRKTTISGTSDLPEK